MSSCDVECYVTAVQPYLRKAKLIDIYQVGLTMLRCHLGSVVLHQHVDLNFEPKG